MIKKVQISCVAGVSIVIIAALFSGRERTIIVRKNVKRKKKSNPVTSF